MAISKDRIMRRSVQQAMYRYLPGRWIDFYIKSSRDSYSAYVENWNSDKLEGANTNRIKREVWRRLQAIDAFTYGYAPLEDETAWSVLTPKVEDSNSAVIAAVSPLVFFCSSPSCRRVVQYNFSDRFLQNPQNTKCKYCSNPLTQVRLIYYCNCGHAEPVRVPNASCACHAQLVQKSSFVFACSKCHREAELRATCPRCSKPMFPRNALDNAQYYPHSFSLIDLVNQEQEKYISENEDGCWLTLAYWFGYISRERYHEAIQINLHSGIQQDKEALINEQVEKFRNMGIPLPEETLRAMAASAINTVDPIKDVTEAISKAKTLIPINSGDITPVRNAALKILEYDTVFFADQVRNLSEAAQIAVDINEIDNVDKFFTAVNQAKFSYVQASGKVPFISAVYGYSRKHNEVGKEDTKLCAFVKEKATKSNIYATKMETEGVLFEIDRRAILKWLQANNVINSSEYYEDMSDDEVKAWFLQNCDDSVVSPFGEIDEAIHYRFAWVFKLMHSISHELIRQAAVISGLDKSSLSEYLFTGIPAIFIYCQNAQGFNLGAMFSAMEAQLDYWINSSREEIYQCIFDPVCREEEGACAGCLFLNDISCHYMNKHLDRRLLTGYSDSNGNHVVGFWEE